MTANPPPGTARERDFDLIDLFHEITSRWVLILACIVLFTVVGAIVVSQTDRVYRYVTTIEIGHVASINGQGTNQFVEPAASAASRLETAHIPAVTGESEGESRSLITATSNEGIEGLVTLQSVAPLDAATATAALHQEVASRLQQDHSRRIEAQRETIQQDFDRLQEIIVDIDDEIANLRADEENISNSLNQALEDLATIGSQNAASDSSSTAEGAANQTNILLERQSLLANFDRSRQAVVERRRDLVERQRGLRQEASIRSLALTSVRDTEVIGTAVRSIEPTGPGPGLVLAASVLTGIVVGIAVAILLFLFGAVARRRAAERA